jgi:hypothetical protein
MRGGLHLGFRAEGLSLNPKGTRGLYSRLKVKGLGFGNLFIKVSNSISRGLNPNRV